ncbi:MAG: DUF2339 domain-containing protein [Eubacteriales bacterium]|nr:DUF2339 domain-containing protein [Eubacteriales bacterium]
MSSRQKKLTELIDQQQALLNSLKSEAAAINSDSLVKENEQLKESVSRLSESQAKLKAENQELKKSLESTKTALFTKIANEKLSVFNSTQKRIENTYYRKEFEAGSRLKDYETNCLDSINETIKAIEEYGSQEFNDIINRLNLLKTEVSQKREELESLKNEQIDNASRTNFAIGKQLKEEGLTEAEKRTAVRQKSLESFIGLNVLGKAGIFLFIVGIIMLGRYAYVHMSDFVKGGAIYMLGIALVAVGELFYKKEKTIFSTTLISGGVATLYAAAATCYFAFDLYDVKVTFIICVLITAIAVAISNQVKSQVVCGFAAVGGYLPVVALYMIGFGKAKADPSFLPVSGVYFCALAVVLFLMTYNKKWYIPQFIGYGLHLVAVGGIAQCAYSVRKAVGYEYALPFAVGFAIVSFVIYLMMPGAKIVRRKVMHTADSVLLALNTVSGAVSVSFTMHNCVADSVVGNRLVGFVFLAFTVIYIVLSTFSVKSKSSKSQVSTIITCISALAFSMLIVPLIFGMEYTGIAWALEGLVLALVSIEKKLKAPELAGLVCMIMSVAAVFCTAQDSSQSIMIVAYSVVLSVFWIYSVRGLSDNGRVRTAFVYIITEIASASATVGYIAYLYDCIMNSPRIIIYSEFSYYAVIFVAALIILAALRMGVLKNTVSMIVSDIGAVVLMLFVVFYLNYQCFYYDVFTYYGAEAKKSALVAINLALLVVVNIATELLFASSVLDIVNRLKAPVWIFTMAISVSSLALITSVLMDQFNIEFSSVIISAVYIALACVMLFLGFKNRHTVVRSGGLVLILCAFAKLCFVDTAHLDSGWKIAAYFAFGAILIGVSFFYQRFSKKIESDMQMIVEDKTTGE